MLSPADAAVVRRDPSVPGLSMLLDHERLLEELGARFPHLAITSLVPRYLRYKPGTNCLVAYDATFAGRREMLHAKAFASGPASKLAKARALPTTNELGRPMLEDQGVVVSAFPDDAKVRRIADVFREAPRRRMLRAILGDDRDDWGGQTVQSYKPERRCVLKVVVGGKPLVLRLFARGGVNATPGAQGAGLDWPVRIPRELGRAARKDAVALEWLAGSTLRDRRAAPSLFGASSWLWLQRLGRKLAEFQRVPLLTSEVRTAADALGRAEAAAASVTALLPSLKDDVERVLSLLEVKLPADAADTQALVHGDFYDKQIIVSNTPGFIDLDQLCRGGAAVDLGCFLAHLQRDRGRGTLSAGDAARMRRGLLDGYASVRDVPESLPWFTAVELLRLAPDAFRRREPEWPDRARELVAQALGVVCGTGGRRVGMRPRKPRWPRRTHRPQAELNETRRVSTVIGGVQPTWTHTRMPQQEPTQGWASLLARALDRSTVAPLITEARRQDTGDASLVTVAEARLFREKPDRRALVSYVCHVAEGRHRLLGKIRAKGLDKRTPSLVRGLVASGFGSDASDGIHVPDYRGLVPGLRMWLQTQIEAVPLERLLLDAGPPIDLPDRIAAAIHKLHQTSLVVSRHHTTAHELETLSAGLRSWAGDNARRITCARRLVAGSRRTLESASPAPSRLVHRDFYQDQVLIAPDDRVYLVDLDLASMGDPALDIGNFVAHLVELEIRRGDLGLGLSDFADRFAHAYCERSGTPANRVYGYATVSLVRHVFLSERIPGRAHTTDRLVDECLERFALAVGT